MVEHQLVVLKQEIMEGHIAPYLKEVGLAGNLPGQFQGTLRTLLRVYMCLYYTRADAACRVHEFI